MKKSILIAIVTLISGGTYLSLNAQDMDCGSTGLRRTFDGAGIAPGAQENKPSVRPETGSSDQAGFSSSGGSVGSVSAGASSSHPKKMAPSTPEERKKEGIALGILGGVTALGGAAIFLMTPHLVVGTVVILLGAVLCKLGILATRSSS